MSCHQPACLCFSCFFIIDNNNSLNTCCGPVNQLLLTACLSVCHHTTEMKFEEINLCTLAGKGGDFKLE